MTVTHHRVPVCGMYYHQRTFKNTSLSLLLLLPVVSVDESEKSFSCLLGKGFLVQISPFHFTESHTSYLQDLLRKKYSNLKRVSRKAHNCFAESLWFMPFYYVLEAT